MRDESEVISPLVSFKTNRIYAVIYRQHLSMKAEPQYYYIYHLVGQFAAMIYNTTITVVTSSSSLKFTHL